MKYRFYSAKFRLLNFSLYSDYNFMRFYGKTPRTPELFHKKVVHSINTFSACLKKRSLRGCTYETMATFCTTRATQTDYTVSLSGFLIKTSLIVPSIFLKIYVWWSLLLCLLLWEMLSLACEVSRIVEWSLKLPLKYLNHLER